MTGKKQKYLSLFALILAGEAIFFLPFVIPRIFKPTFLEFFGISNLQLGLFYSAYGTVAIVAYLLGGPIADRFAPSKLMSLALVMTAIGGFFMITIPSISQMPLLYGFWGITTILLFWSALFRTTRMIGGESQGFAFGLLDGGRGLTSAIVSTIAAWLFAYLLGERIDAISTVDRQEVFKKVILFFTGFVFLAAILIKLIIKKIDHIGFEKREKLDLKRILNVLKIPAVWLQALIILCAYSCYRVTDNFSLLAFDVLKYNEADAAGLAALTLWLRPISAIGVGLIADRLSPSRMIQVCFTLLVMAGLSFGCGLFEEEEVIHVLLVIISTSIAVFALRGLYFAIMQEGKIPLAVTGTAVGIASMIGYLPDIFMAPAMGYLLDNSPGKLGHQHVFLLVAVISTIGFIVTLIFRKVVAK